MFAEKMNEYIEMESQINAMIREVINQLTESVQNERLEGVTTLKTGVITVKLSMMIKQNSWSPDTYLPEAQVEAIKKALKTATFKTIGERVRTLLKEKRVKVYSNWKGRDSYTKLNEETIQIIKNSELGKWATSSVDSKLCSD